MTSSPSRAQQPDDPFTPADRWAHYVHRTYSPIRMSILAADTAIDHGLRDPHCWDESASSYGMRYARAFQRRVVRNSVELGAGILTHEDLRYRPSLSGSMIRRVLHALRGSVVATMPDGSVRPAYTRALASVAADVSSAPWTSQPIRPVWLSESLAWSTLGQMQTNLLDEFGPDMRRFGGKVWGRVVRTAPFRGSAARP